MKLFKQLSFFTLAIVLILVFDFALALTVVIFPPKYALVTLATLFLERLLCSLATSAEAYDLPALIDVARTLSEEIEYSEDNTAAIREALRRAFGEQEPF